MESSNRTNQQSRSMHLLFDQVSKELVQQGIDQRTVIEHLQGYDCPVTPEFLKEIWKSIMYTMYRKTSTTKLTTKEMTDCYDVFNKFMGENFGIETPWPSIETLLFNQLES